MSWGEKQNMAIPNLMKQNIAKPNWTKPNWAKTNLTLTNLALPKQSKHGHGGTWTQSHMDQFNPELGKT